MRKFTAILVVMALAFTGTTYASQEKEKEIIPTSSSSSSSTSSAVEVNQNKIIPVFYRDIGSNGHNCWIGTEYVSIPNDFTIQLNNVFTSVGLGGHTIPLRTSVNSINAKNIVGFIRYGDHFKMGKGVFQDIGLTKGNAVAILLKGVPVGIETNDLSANQSQYLTNNWEWKSIQGKSNEEKQQALIAAMGDPHIIVNIDTEPALTDLLNEKQKASLPPGEMEIKNINPLNNLPPQQDVITLTAELTNVLNSAAPK
jgi:hypothetical protein